MECPKCKAGETIKGTTSQEYTRECSKSRILVSGIPVDVCPYCGEDYVSKEVASKVSRFVNGILELETTTMKGKLPPLQMMVYFPPEVPCVSAQEIQRQFIKKVHDIMVFDRDDFPVIVGRVTAIKRFTDEQRIYYFRQAQGWAEYVLVVSKSQIELWKSCTEESVATFDTKTALEPYNNGRNSFEKLNHDSIENLTLYWLNDVISHWKDDNVPYKEEFKKLGLVERLKYGIAHRNLKNE